MTNTNAGRKAQDFAEFAFQRAQEAATAEEAAIWGDASKAAENAAQAERRKADDAMRRAFGGSKS